MLCFSFEIIVFVFLRKNTEFLKLYFLATRHDLKHDECLMDKNFLHISLTQLLKLKKKLKNKQNRKA